MYIFAYEKIHKLPHAHVISATYSGAKSTSATEIDAWVVELRAHDFGSEITG